MCILIFLQPFRSPVPFCNQFLPSLRISNFDFLKITLRFQIKLMLIANRN